MSLTEQNSQRMSALIHPLSLEDFMTQVWPEGFLHSTGPSERLSELVQHPDFANIESLVKAQGIRDIRADFTKEKRASMMVGAEKAIELYHQSDCTIYTRGIANEVTNSWKQTLDSALGLIPGRAQVNAFASKAGPGLPWHWDAQEIFVVQVKGKKRWHVAANKDVNWPTMGGRAGSEMHGNLRFQTNDMGKPIEEPTQWETVDLEPGSVMFLPRGYWHTTENTEDSIHLVLQVNLMNWRDVFTYVMENVPAFYSEQWRKPTLALTPEQLMSEGLKEFQQRCAHLSQLATPQGLAQLSQLYAKG